MATFATDRPVINTTGDLDGFSMCSSDYSYPPIQPPTFPQAAGDDFGFDPSPSRFDFGSYPTKAEINSPPDEDDALNAFSFDAVKPERTHATDLDKLHQLQSTANSVMRHGQVTPPRSNSEPSIGKPTDQKPQRQRRSTKATIKEEAQNQAPSSGRKRRNTRKSSVVSAGCPEEDEKRKQSLEKNRLAAAKCRVNKKEKTEQLQRDSHDKACQNAFLNEQVMRMKEEIQQMNALLLQHANHEGCKSSEDIQVHLNNMSHDFYPSHMGIPHDFAAFGGMSEMEQNSYFSPASDMSLMNPPLPEFDRDADFDVSTPLHSSPMDDD